MGTTLTDSGGRRQWRLPRLIKSAFRPRYSLRVFLILIGVVCTGLGFAGYRVRTARLEREAADRIEELGGRVGWDYQITQRGNMLRYEPPSEWAVWWGTSHVVRVDLCDCEEVDDDALLVLRELPHVQRLLLDHTSITDRGLAEVARLKDLRSLFLNGTTITDRGLVELEGLNDLFMLSIGARFRTTVRADGTEHDEIVQPDLTDECVQRFKSKIPDLIVQG